MKINQNSAPGPRRVVNRDGNQLSKKRIAYSLYNCTKIYVNHRVVGEEQGDVFVKWVSKRKHFYHQGQSWCFDVSTHIDATRYGALWVELREEDSGLTYRTVIDTIYEKGDDVDEVYGIQIGLYLKYWSRGDEPFGEQLKMWGEA